jgi:hypothetical protein
MEEGAMIKTLDYRSIDLAMVVIANLVNVALIGIFISRPYSLPKVEYYLGLFLAGLVLPIIALVIQNARGQREWWTIVLPIILAAFLLIEYILEYALGINWRETWMRGPVLLHYYVSVMVMIGYAFLANKAYGVVTLITYFLSLGATWFSLSRVGY